MMQSRILLTGASGFIGRHVLRELLARNAWVRVLVHQSEVEGAAAEKLRADLSKPESLDGICRGIDVVIHLATHIGSDPERCERINAFGTQHLVRMARADGAGRIIYVSSAAVYGFAVHRGSNEDQVLPAPETPISSSRVPGEQAVLKAGGIVLRPLFVYGNGDTRFIPKIQKAARTIPFLVEGGRARLSVIPVARLAEVVSDLAMADQFKSGIYHATDNQPVSFIDIVKTLADLFGTTVPKFTIPYVLAKWVLRLSSPRLLGGSGWSKASEHRLFLVSRDHYYDSSRLWDLTGRDPGPPITERLQDYADWYRKYL
jgi:nucleoside-diphosphate-sugar epimerase